MTRSETPYSVAAAVLFVRVVQVALALWVGITLVLLPLVGGLSVRPVAVVALVALVGLVATTGLEGLVRVVRGRFGGGADG